MPSNFDTLLDHLYVHLLSLISSVFSSTPWYLFQMALDNLGVSYALSWLYGALTSHSTPASINNGVYGTTAEKTHKKKKSTGHSSLGGQNAVVADEVVARGGHYPGLVNISGTYCFMNSVLQAFASLSYLVPYVDLVHEKAELYDVPTPVVDALRDTLTTLNTPSPRRSHIRPIPMIEALSAPSPNGTKPLLFSSREHQDAQELFQLLSSLIKEEATAVDRDVEKRFVGLVGALDGFSPNGEADREQTYSVSKSVFEGLTANRRSCVVCGYTEAVMHFGFDNLQLSLPYAASVSLHIVLEELTRIETLTDCSCRKCSLIATHKRLQADVEKYHADELDGVDSTMSQSKRKRWKEVKKLEAKVWSAISEGRIEDELKGVKVDRVVSRASTKQTMIARAPPVLALHLNRSSFWGHTASKNITRVIYPEVLDLSPYTTSGLLSTSPSLPISPHPSSTALTSQHFSLPGQSQLSPSSPKVLYLLSAIVCHYGAHAFGHYVAYRRKPRTVASSSSSSSPRFRPPTLRDASDTGTGRGWLRLSDDVVEEVGIETVLGEQSGAFMLFYEKIDMESSVFSLTEAPSSSSSAHKSDAAPVPGDSSPSPSMSSRASTPRIIRSVSTGKHSFASVRRSKSLSRSVSTPPDSSPALSRTSTPGVEQTSTNQVLSSSTDTITPSRLPNGKPSERSGGNQSELGGHSTDTVSQSDSNGNAASPPSLQVPSKKHKSRHKEKKADTSVNVS